MYDTQANSLDDALRQAANEPAARPGFYRQLLESDVLVLGQSDAPAGASAVLPAGAKVQLVNWMREDGSPVLPFFTSQAALEAAAEPGAPFLRLSARALFDLTRGAALVLNPKSPYGKEFFPEEIAALLDHGVNRLPEQRVVQEDTQVMLGQPAEMPAAMLASLKTLFAGRDNVLAAFLAQIHEPARDEYPRLLIGIQAEGDVEALMREAGMVAADSAPPGRMVDMVRVQPGEEGLSAYFLREVAPFHVRRKPGLLKRLFG